MADVALSDDDLEFAGALLVLGSRAMVEHNEATPTGNLQSLTGIGGHVRIFVNGLQTGRSALADAAKTAGHEVAGVMRDSSDLDAHLAESLGAGFAVTGHRR